MYHISDALMSQLLQGSEEAFGVWFHETVDDFTRYVRFRHQLDDATTEDIVAIFYMRMRDTLPTLADDTDEDRLYVYCRTVLNNLVKDSFKKKTDQPFADYRDQESDEVTLPLVSDDDVADLFAQQFAVDQILETLRGMSDDLYTIFYLKYLEGYDYESIAEQLGLSYDAVRQQHSRAIRLLQAGLSDQLS